MSDANLRPIVSTALQRCDELARLSESPPPVLTRTFLSAPVREVHRLVGRWMNEARMTVRIDGIGNIVGRYEGASASAPALLIGSHLDTVPDAGKFDGVLGVMLGIAAVEALVGRRLPIAIEVVGFSEEEGCRFATPYLGSLGFTGRITPELLALRDEQNVGVDDAARAFGLDPAALAFDATRYLGYLEAHIEQGPVLEAGGAPLGVVSAIVGQSRRQLTFTGRAGHAGTTPMNLRHDALAAAAAWVGHVEALAKGSGGVATVGQLAVTPGASNVIPGAARASLDVRHTIDAARLQLLSEILAAAQTIAIARGVTLEVSSASDHASVNMDASMIGRLNSAVGDDAPLLPSGAGHDAAVLAAVVPAAMLFLRSPGGISHHPDERVYAADVELALAAIVRFVEGFAADNA